MKLKCIFPIPGNHLARLLETEIPSRRKKENHFHP